MTEFKDHFSGVASDYAVHRPIYPTALVDHLATVAARRARAWDCGCGSGQLSVLLAERFERVVATDASLGQLRRMRPHPRVDTCACAAENVALAGGSVDLAVSAQAAHWFDLPRFLAEVRRVTRPGGAAALVSYGLVRIGERLDALIERFYRDVLGPHWPPERRHVESGYRSLPFPFEELPSPELEIRADWPLARLVGYLDTWSAVRALERSGGRERAEAFYEELAAAWGPPGARRTVRWPLSVRVGRVGDR